jgi:hypothetical protein
MVPRVVEGWLPNGCNQMATLLSSSSSSSNKEEEGVAKAPPRARFLKPSVDDVASFGLTLAPPFCEADKFCDYYESNGWKVGKGSMKDWRAAVRNWARRNTETAKPAVRPAWEKSAKRSAWD